MKHISIKSESSKSIILSLISVAFIALMLLFSEDVKISAYNAVNSCITTVIPCIFPITAISFFLLETGAPVKLQHLTDRFLIKAFGLSGSCLEGIVLGLTGGYNMAVKCAIRLKNEGRITAEQAKRIALFFTNPGISFTVLLTGASLSGSVGNGIRIYLFTVFGNVLTAFLYNKYNKHSEACQCSQKRVSSADALTASVERAASTVISISFNIIFFAVITGITEKLLPYEAMRSAIRLICEVSGAVIYSAKHFPLYITAAVLTFGGLCIFIQNLKDIQALGFSPRSYLTIRIFNAFFVLTTEYIYSSFVPAADYASSLYQIKLTAAHSSSGAFALIFLCAVYLVSVRNIKTHGITTKKVQ